MKRLSALSKAAVMGLIASAGVPGAAALNHLFSPAEKRPARKPKAGKRPEDLAALAKAEAKRERRAGRNKERT